MTRSSPQDARATGSPWRATVLTLYPEMFPGPLGCAVAGRALESGVWALETVDIRDFARDKHRTVDDHPFGGGPGMVTRPDVVARAVDSARERSGDVPVFCLSPRGVLLDQTRVQAFARGAGVMLLCGHFEGVDERLLERRGIEELSVGDYVLSGGEVAAMALIDACVRLLPGVLGAPESLAEESFEQGLLEYPQYTRPRVFEGKSVPEILLSGDHERIRRWRREQAEKITRERRADLWTRRTGRAAQG